MQPFIDSKRLPGRQGCEAFVDEAMKQLASAGDRVQYYVQTMQDYTPEPKK